LICIKPEKFWLNVAMDDVFAQLRSKEISNGVVVNYDEIEVAT